MSWPYESYVCSFLRKADIEVGGSRPWDLRIHDRRFFRRIVWNNSLGFGDSYVEGWWDCDDLASMFERLLPDRSNLQRLSGIPGVILRFKRKLQDLQTLQRAKKVVHEHYDLPLSLFTAMLGPSMVYTCGYWQNAENLSEAQYNKLDLVCRKLQLNADDRVLDIGCGFGSFCRYAAENYGCRVVGITLSGSQADFAREHCKGLPVEIVEADYRNVASYGGVNAFSKIASIGMFEAVGHKNFREFMQIADHVLEDDGLFLLHTIGDSACSSDPWLLEHIFPNGELPEQSQIHQAVSGLFETWDLHEFGHHYTTTLADWVANFINQWSEIQRTNPQLFDASFFRKWTYYLSCCQGAFLSSDLFLWQFLFSKQSLPSQYEKMR